MRISHLKNTILVERIVPDKILLDGLWELKTARVIDVGTPLKKGKMKIKKGDVVFTGDYEGKPFIYDSRYQIYSQNDILAILRGDSLEAVNYVIVQLDEAYHNEKDLGGGKSLTVNISVENVEFINRIGTVISPVDGTVLKEGDRVVIHHNIARKKNDIKGKEINSEWYIRDNIYAVPLTEVFMYKREKDWIALDPYCFVEPIDMERPEKIGNILVPATATLGYKNRVANQAIMKYTNRELEKDGVLEGTKVITKKHAEYEFVIDGKLMYRTRTDSVLAIIGT